MTAAPDASLVTGVAAIIVSIVTLAGVLINAVVSRRKNQADSENSLIDQLQEELKTYRADAERRATAQDERMNRLEVMVDGYRTYARELRSHIWGRKEPPPPEWPAGLPQ